MPFLWNPQFHRLTFMLTLSITNFNPAYVAYVCMYVHVNTQVDQKTHLNACPTTPTRSPRPRLGNQPTVLRTFIIVVDNCSCLFTTAVTHVEVALKFVAATAQKQMLSLGDQLQDHTPCKLTFWPIVSYFLKSPFRVSSFYQLSLFPYFPPSNVLGVQLLMPTTGSLLATEDYKNEAQVLVAVVIMMQKNCGEDD